MNLKMYHADGTYSLNLLHFYLIGSKGYSSLDCLQSRLIAKCILHKSENTLNQGSLLSFQIFAPKHVATGEDVKVSVDSKLNKNVRLTNVKFDP